MQLPSLGLDLVSLKPGFHYPSWRPELTARVDGWPVSITRQHGPCWRARVSTSRVEIKLYRYLKNSCQHSPWTRLVETRAGQHGPCWRVMETGHPSTRAVNSGRQLGEWKPGLTLISMKTSFLFVSSIYLHLSWLKHWPKRLKFDKRRKDESKNWYFDVDRLLFNVFYLVKCYKREATQLVC